jgi:hypothetical protein
MSAFVRLSLQASPCIVFEATWWMLNKKLLTAIAVKITVSCDIMLSNLVSTDISKEPWRWGFAALSETSVLVRQITRRPMPEDNNLHLAGAEEILLEDVHRKLSCEFRVHFGP